MKNKSNLIALLLAMALMLSVFCGCQTSTPEVTGPAETETAETSGGAPVEESEAAEVTETVEAETTEEAQPQEAAYEPFRAENPTTLTYMVTINPMNANLYTSFQDLAIWNELEARTNVTVDATLVNAQEGQTKFNLMVASGEYTDWLDSVSSNYATGVVGALDDDVIIDLTDIIKEQMPNYWSYLSSSDEYLKGATQDDGRMGMIFALTRLEVDDCTSGPVIRQDWLDALGLDTPVTYDDLHDVLVAFKDNYGASMWIPYTGSPMGGYLGAGFDTFTTYMTHLRGREPFYQRDGEICFGPIDDQYYDYLELMAAWYDEGLIWSDFTSYTQAFDAPPDDMVMNGSFGVWFGNTGKWDVYTAGATDPNFHCVAFADPVMEAGNINHIRNMNEHITNGGISISTQCTEDKLAASIGLLDYFYSEEGSFLITFGTEGVTFEYDADGHPQYTELITNNPDGYSQSQAMTLYCGSTVNTTIQHPEADYLVNTNTDDQNAASDIWKATSDAAYDIPDLCTISQEDSETYTAVMSDIGSFVSEWSLKVITGVQELTPEAFEAYRSQLTDVLNIQQAIDIKQDALDRYNQR